MTKGIRSFANDTFANTLPKLAEWGPTTFRASVIAAVMGQFDISLASAATHYNHAFKVQKAADPASVAGLGRSEDKKGGRKPIHVVTVVKAKSGAVVAEGVSRAKAADMIAANAGKKGAPKLAILAVEAVEAVAA